MDRDTANRLEQWLRETQGIVPEPGEVDVAATAFNRARDDVRALSASLRFGAEPGDMLRALEEMADQT